MNRPMRQIAACFIGVLLIAGNVLLFQPIRAWWTPYTTVLIDNGGWRFRLQNHVARVSGGTAYGIPPGIIEPDDIKFIVTVRRRDDPTDVRDVCRGKCEDVVDRNGPRIECAAEFQWWPGTYEIHALRFAEPPLGAGRDGTAADDPWPVQLPSLKRRVWIPTRVMVYDKHD